MYGKEGCSKTSNTKTCSAKMGMLLAENSDIEEDDSPAPSVTPWSTDFDEYLRDKPKGIPAGISLIQWWCVHAQYLFSLLHSLI